MILFCGDIHGDWKSFLNQLRRKKITNTHIIICGDIGLGFKQNEDKEIKELEHYNTPFSKDGNIIYCIRGNHDNPEYFKSSSLNFSNIKLVDDYTVLNLEGLNILCLGGAVSVDRYSRVINKNMWPKEEFYFDINKLEAFENIDIVASHTIWDQNKVSDEMEIGFFKSMDEDLNHDLEIERLMMQKAKNILLKKNRLVVWYHGHFHKSLERIDCKGLTVIGLNIQELKEHKHCIKRKPIKVLHKEIKSCWECPFQQYNEDEGCIIEEDGTRVSQANYCDLTGKVIDPRMKTGFLEDCELDDLK